MSNQSEPAPILLDIRMHDGSRHFGGVPQNVLWYEMRDAVETLPGASLAGFVTDGVTEAWIDFTYAGHTFAINDQFGEYWFLVDDPACPDEILMRVLRHFVDAARPA